MIEPVNTVSFRPDVQSQVTPACELNRQVYMSWSRPARELPEKWSQYGQK